MKFLNWCLAFSLVDMVVSDRERWVNLAQQEMTSGSYIVLSVMCVSNCCLCREVKGPRERRESRYVQAETGMCISVES